MQGLQGLVGSMSSALSPHAMSAFFLGSGFTVVAAGSSAGQIFSDLVNSTVTDLAMPLTYVVFRSVLGERPALNDAFRNVKTRVDHFAFVQSLLKFLVGAFVLYVLMQIVLINILNRLDAGYGPAATAPQ